MRFSFSYNKIRNSNFKMGLNKIRIPNFKMGLRRVLSRAKRFSILKKISS